MDSVFPAFSDEYKRSAEEGEQLSSADRLSILLFERAELQNRGIESPLGCHGFGPDSNARIVPAAGFPLAV